MLTRDKVMMEIRDKALFTVQYRMILDGEPTYVACQAALVEEKDGPQLIIGINNIDNQVRREQDYERKLAAARSRANLDTLTGVKNRTAYDNMSQTLSRQIEGGQSVRYAIALCRVLDLEYVNQTRGKEAGNALIREGCAVICDTFKHSPVFRVAGDQFAVIIQGRDLEEVDSLVAEMAEKRDSRAPAVSCGIAVYDGTENVASVFARAERLCT